MCRALENIRTEERVRLALRMLRAGKYSYEEIANLVEMSVDEVRALNEQKPA